MRFISIKLNNFRQYKDVLINFSVDDEKPITLIDGDNGNGKTTLVQAFNWCLFGPTYTKLDKIELLINDEVLDTLEIGESDKVFVELKFEHNDELYSIQREVTAKKVHDHSARYSEMNFAAMKKNSDGILIEVNNAELQRIVPESLSRYFFFDGERMEKLNDTKEGQDDLSETIKRRLGITVLDNAIEDAKYVERDLNKNIVKDNPEASTLLNNVEKSRNILKKKRIELNNLEVEKKCIENSINENSVALKSFQPVKELENKRLENERLINDAKQRQEKASKLYIQKFWKESSKVFLNNLMINAYKKIDESESLNKGINGINADAINEILHRGKCICGCEIEEGSEKYNNLVDLKKYIPPESLSTLTKVMRERVDANSNSVPDIEDYLEKSVDEYDELGTKLIDLKSKQEDIHEEIRQIGQDSDQRIKELEIDRENLANERDQVVEKIGSVKRDIDLYKKKIDTLDQNLNRILKDEKDNDIVKSKYELARLVTSEIQRIKEFKISEVRNKLEVYVSESFSRLLNADRRISIDDKYRLTVTSEYGNPVLSEGQKIVVSFAFVSALIKLSKLGDQRETKYTNSELPLVMDAPFAKLDESHRQKVCSELPEFANQIILLTTTSQLGENSYDILKTHIGKRYSIVDEENAKASIVVEKELG